MKILKLKLIENESGKNCIRQNLFGNILNLDCNNFSYWILFMDF